MLRSKLLLPAFHGPLWPEVSPDGTKIAYTYSFTASYFDYRCNCNRVAPSMNTSYTYANRFVEWPDRVFGLMRFHSNASWVDNRTTLATTEHLYDFGGNVMDSVAVDKLGGDLDAVAGAADVAFVATTFARAGEQQAVPVGERREHAAADLAFVGGAEILERARASAGASTVSKVRNFHTMNGRPATP